MYTYYIYVCVCVCMHMHICRYTVRRNSLQRVALFDPQKTNSTPTSRVPSGGLRITAMPARLMMLEGHALFSRKLFTCQSDCQKDNL